MKNNFQSSSLITPLALLVVPVILSSCQRTILSDKNAGKQVTGKLATASVSAPTPKEPENGIKVTVWFTKLENERMVYVPEVRSTVAHLPDAKSGALPFALNELLAGPNGKHELESTGLTPEPSSGQSASSQTNGEAVGLVSSEIPPRTKLLSITGDETSGKITINLSSEFARGGGSDSFEARLEQVRKTVESLGIRVPVYLDVDGQRLTASGDGLEVKQPINSNFGEEAGAASPH